MRTTCSHLATPLIVLIVAARLYAVAYTAEPKKTTVRRPSGTPYIATAYCLDGRTASGEQTRGGRIAADRRLLPLGSVVRIHTPGLKYSGTYTVTDTGPAVKGRKVDIFIADCRRARAFGRRHVTLTVLRRGERPS
jgi:3D (Asp-Asp-Asp) domain-containing protein